MEIKLTDEQIIEIVLTELSNLRLHFIDMLDSDEPINLFSLNPTYDKLLIQKHLEAVTLIKEWFQ